VVGVWGEDFQHFKLDFHPIKGLMVRGVNGHHFQSVPQAVFTVMKDNYMLAAQASWYQQDDATTPGMQYVIELMVVIKFQTFLYFGSEGL
jgi:sensor domain CHASE-containing protein